MKTIVKFLTLPNCRNLQNQLEKKCDNLDEKKKIFVQLSHNKKLFVSFLIEMNIRGMRDSIINNNIIIPQLMKNILPDYNTKQGKNLF